MSPVWSFLLASETQLPCFRSSWALFAPRSQDVPSRPHWHTKKSPPFANLPIDRSLRSCLESMALDDGIERGGAHWELWNLSQAGTAQELAAQNGRIPFFARSISPATREQFGLIKNMLNRFRKIFKHVTQKVQRKVGTPLGVNASILSNTLHFSGCVAPKSIPLVSFQSQWHLSDSRPLLDVCLHITYICI